MRVGPFSILSLRSLALVAVTLATFVSSQAFAKAQPQRRVVASCWDPTKEPAIAELFTPNAQYKEDARTIELIHDTIWSHREDIDPRLVYHRIVGESHGDPFVLSPDKKYYGLFQFGGRPYGSKQTHKQIIEGLIRKNPRTSPRLIQIKYYLEQYLQNFITAADAGTGCNRDKKYHQYTNIERSTYLNYGACDRSALSKELAKCAKPKDPKKPSEAPYAKACVFSFSVTRGRGSRLCERQNPGTRQVPGPRRSSPKPVPVRKSASSR